MIPIFSGNNPMKSPNEYGVYEPEHKETFARFGRAEASVSICHCDDGLYRWSCSLSYSHGGSSSPILHSAAGRATYREAMNAGTAELLKRFPATYPCDPQSVKKELDTMRRQLEALMLQPCLL
jgi:DNA-binding IclR family transcriptional regulator